MHRPRLGIYEKALPANLSWPERLAVAKACGYDFVEISIDESDARLERLQWSKAQRLDLLRAVLDTGMPLSSLCLSAHRRFPFGSRDAARRTRAYEIMAEALQFAQDCGIRSIQLAGYDVYYEESDAQSEALFLEGMRWTAARAAERQIMVALEIMDTPFLNSIRRWLDYQRLIQNPWFQVYPDLGNLSAWNADVLAELEAGLPHIIALHVKDTLPPRDGFPGQFRDVDFGAGCVDFPKIFKYLREQNYRGSFLIEMWTEKLAEPLPALLQARQWLEAQLKAAGFGEALPA